MSTNHKLKVMYISEMWSLLLSYSCPNSKIDLYKSLQQFIFIFTEIRVSTPDNTLGSAAVSPERGNTPVPLPQPELDPDSLRSDLRDFLQELREAQRERVTEEHVNAYFNPRIFSHLYGWRFCFSLILKDDARCQLGVLQRELEELTRERDSAQSRLTQLQNSLQEYQEGDRYWLMEENPNHKTKQM